MGACIFGGLLVIFLVWATIRISTVTLDPSQAQPCLPWALLLGVIALACALITFGE